MADKSKERALHYHEQPRPGKLEVRATKPMENQRDLSLAYSPGVAEACMEIVTDATTAERYTARGNLGALLLMGRRFWGLEILERWPLSL